MADQGAGELQEPEVDVGAALPPDPQPPEGVQPGEAAFDDPADLAQPEPCATRGGQCVGDSLPT